MSRNKGGAPKKETKKSERVVVRLTEKEKEKLILLEKETGIKRSNLFVLRVIENREFLITKDVIQELSNAGAEMGRVGNNINQLARHANTVFKAGPVPQQVIQDFEQLLEKHLQIESNIYAIFKSMYRVMKK
ncbi:plasmid mobilization protein [Mucilaginibacter arboris]|uniref:Plasmid mobilization relaxosome protein MobC n=1 Tax=Mucilaginibacter arboris TaxID=2682090 RepID=A0A7K1T063_9SPHI|nr:plasmid mobilization relaxosome protein MobC [Mucilaginibacter arboris]MVN22956.1 plasmid mobilization relaxosome protein MobC [Mucilaginibacter arboris]